LVHEDANYAYKDEKGLVFHVRDIWYLTKLRRKTLNVGKIGGFAKIF
jgi:hypothetical protein